MAFASSSAAAHGIRPSQQTLLRLRKELAMLSSDPPPGVACWPTDLTSLLEAHISGPTGSPFESGIFKLQIHIPDRYPFEAPKIQFTTKIYHPNIDDQGRICLDSLKMPPKGSWKPSLNISTLLTSILLLLDDPNPDDPLVTEIAFEFKSNYPLFVQKAKDMTLRYAQEPQINASVSPLIPVEKFIEIDALKRDASDGASLGDAPDAKITTSPVPMNSQILRIGPLEILEKYADTTVEKNESVATPLKPSPFSTSALKTPRGEKRVLIPENPEKVKTGFRLGLGAKRRKAAE